MSFNFNPISTPQPTQQTQATQQTQLKALKEAEATQQVKAANEKTTPDKTTQVDLHLQGYSEIESQAWMQTTDAALDSGQAKLKGALTELEGRQAGTRPASDKLPEELGEFKQLVDTASFQGKTLLKNDAPALEHLSSQSQNPPYFLTNSREAVQLFRQEMAERIQAELDAQQSLDSKPESLPVGEPLAKELQGQVNNLLEDDSLQVGDHVEGEFSAMGVDFQLKGQIASNEKGERYLSEDSAIIAEVNGNELTLEGPFIRPLGPSAADVFELPKNEEQQPVLAVDVKGKISELADSSRLENLSAEELADKINEAISIFDEVRQDLHSSLQSFKEPTQVESKPPVTHETATQAQQEAILTFSQEPWAAMQTQANATPDLVLNTIVE